MTLARALSLFSDAILLGVFLSTFIAAIRTRRQATIDIALFFAAGATIVAISLIWPGRPIAAKFTAVLLLAWPVLLLRIVHDFTRVAPVMMIASVVSFVLSVAAVLLMPAPLPGGVTLAILGYIIISNLYATARFADRARIAQGSRKRRKQAVAVGTTFLALLFVVAGAKTFIPGSPDIYTLLTTICSLGVTIGYFLGFAPPALLRRGWQYPGVVTFISTLNRAAGSHSLSELVGSIEGGLSVAFGTPRAVIALWDAENERLVPPALGQPLFSGEQARSSLGYRAFIERRPIFVDDASTVDPANRETYERNHITALLTAPLIVGGTPIGAVMLFGDTPPLFAEDDISTLTALSAPVAATIQNWQLTEERAAAAAFEESLALERDFLAAAAHELRTPLTSILGEAQLLGRRLAADAIDRARDNATHITLQATRMRDLVNDLLSVARDSSGFVDELEDDDVFAIANAIGHDFPNVRIEGEPTIAPIDGRRMGQVIRNLLDNASKYSPSGTPIDLRVHRVLDEVVIEVEDRGIGIPVAERTHVFERFVRGASTQHSETEGMGLGLYLCHRIITEHGGTIRIESGSEGGSLFIISLPTSRADQDVDELGMSVPAPRELQPEVAGTTQTSSAEAAAAPLA